MSRRYKWYNVHNWFMADSRNNIFVKVSLSIYNKVAVKFFLFYWPIFYWVFFWIWSAVSEGKEIFYQLLAALNFLLKPELDWKFSTNCQCVPANKFSFILFSIKSISSNFSDFIWYTGICSAWDCKFWQNIVWYRYVVRWGAQLCVVSFIQWQNGTSLLITNKYLFVECPVFHHLWVLQILR